MAVAGLARLFVRPGPSPGEQRRAIVTVSRGVLLFIAAVVAVGAVALVGRSRGVTSENAPGDGAGGLATSPPPAAGAESCRSCHAAIFEQWEASPHGQTSVALAEPPGGAELAIGSRWMQAFLRRDAAGTHRIGADCWDVRRGRWRGVDEVMDAIQGEMMPEERGARPPRHTAERSFERDCSGCHVSGARLRGDPEHGRIRGDWRSPSIDCEACHGPALAHVEAWKEMDDRAPLMELERLDARTATAVCVRCHGATAVGSGFTPADAEYLIAPPRTTDGIYSHGAAAGQIYQGDAFLRSACHVEGGLTCTGCHDPHGPGLLHTDRPDALCTRCHSSDFGSDHTHHAADGAGARCVACHMPTLLTGLMAHQRDHRISSPVPAATEAPNACTGCHLDEGASWAAEWTATWWGPPSRETLAAVRGVHLARGGDLETARPLLRQALRHREPFFRWAAARWLGDPATLVTETLPEGRLLGLEIAARHPDGDEVLARGLRDQSPVLRAVAYVFRLHRGAALVDPPVADLALAARLSRESAEIRVVLARIYIARGRVPEALDLLEETVVYRDRDADAWLLLAATYALVDRDAAAAASIRRWSELTDALPHLEELVTTVTRSGEVPLARAILGAAADHLPDPRRRDAAVRRRAAFEALLEEAPR